jgi:hypothetical protein
MPRKIFDDRNEAREIRQRSLTGGLKPTPPGGSTHLGGAGFSPRKPAQADRSLKGCPTSGSHI